jgi:hypothetical protein
MRAADAEKINGGFKQIQRMVKTAEKQAVSVPASGSMLRIDRYPNFLPVQKHEMLEESRDKPSDKVRFIQRSFRFTSPLLRGAMFPRQCRGKEPPLSARRCVA